MKRFALAFFFMALMALSLLGQSDPGTKYVGRLGGQPMTTQQRLALNQLFEGEIVDDVTLHQSMIYHQSTGWQVLPGSGGGGSQTPWTQNINGNGFNLTNAGAVSAFLTPNPITNIEGSESVIKVSALITNSAQLYRPNTIWVTNIATNVQSIILIDDGFDSLGFEGDATHATWGTSERFTAEENVNNVANSGVESCDYVGFFVDNTASNGIGSRLWFTDFNLAGPVGVQPNLMNGVTMNMANYYNGFPSFSPDANFWAITRSTGVGGSNPLHNTNQTYEMFAGFAVAGFSGTNADQYGYKYGIRVGGSGSGWDWNPNTTGSDFVRGASHIWTGEKLQDFDQYGLLIDGYDPTYGNLIAHSPIAIAVNTNSGTVVFGDTNYFPFQTVQAIEIPTNAGYVGLQIFPKANGTGLSELLNITDAGNGQGWLQVDDSGTKTSTFGDWRITGGKVGIGTNSPQYPLHVVNTNGDAIIEAQSTSASGQALFYANSGRNDFGGFLAALNGQQAWSIGHFSLTNGIYFGTGPGGNLTNQWLMDYKGNFQSLSSTGTIQVPSIGPSKFVVTDSGQNFVGSLNGSGLTSLNASQLTSGTVPVAQLPVATTGALGVVKPDGSSITISGGVISSTGGSGTITGGDGLFTTGASGALVTGTAPAYTLAGNPTGSTATMTATSNPVVNNLTVLGALNVATQNLTNVLINSNQLAPGQVITGNAAGNGITNEYLWQLPATNWGTNAIPYAAISTNNVNVGTAYATTNGGNGSNSFIALPAMPASFSSAAFGATLTNFISTNENFPSNNCVTLSGTNATIDLNAGAGMIYTLTTNVMWSNFSDLPPNGLTRTVTIGVIPTNNFTMSFDKTNFSLNGFYTSNNLAVGPSNGMYLITVMQFGGTVASNKSIFTITPPSY